MHDTDYFPPWIGSGARESSITGENLQASFPVPLSLLSGPATFITFYSVRLLSPAPAGCPRKYGIDWLLKQETTGPTPLLARLPMARRGTEGASQSQETRNQVEKNPETRLA